MPTYTLSIKPSRTDIGATVDVADDDAAKREANLVARDLVKNHRPMLAQERVTVRDASGRLLYEAYLTDAVMLAPLPCGVDDPL